LFINITIINKYFNNKEKKKEKRTKKKKEKKNPPPKKETNNIYTIQQEWLLEVLDRDWETI